MTIGKKIPLNSLYISILVIIVICISLFLKISVFDNLLSSMSFSLILFFSVIPFVVFSSYKNYKDIFFSARFNKFIVFFCSVGLIGFIILLLSIDHHEAKYISEKLGEAAGKRGIVNHLISFGFYEDIIVRYNGFVLDPNRWCFCLFLFYIIVSFNSTSPWASLAKTIIGISILLTMSRAGISMWLFYLFFSNFLHKNYIRTILVPLLVISAISFSLYYYSLFDVVYDRLTYGITDSSNTRSRGYIWNAYLESITTDWRTLLLGQGTDMDPARVFNITPHNAFLYLGYQFGIIGFLLYLALFICSAISLFKSSSRCLCILNFGLCLLLCMTLTDDYLALPFFWLVPCLLFSQKYLHNVLILREKSSRNISIYSNNK